MTCAERRTMPASLPGQVARAGLMACGARASVYRRALRGLLCSSILASGLMLADATMPGVAHAAACTATTVTNIATQTTCTGGTSTATLTYPVSNGGYGGGAFTLLLTGHTVTPVAVDADGILFTGIAANQAGTITLQTNSVITATNGFADGIDATATNAGATTTINIQTGSTVTGGQGGINAVSTGAGAITITTQAGTSVTGMTNDGIDASTNGASNITITALGSVTGASVNSGVGITTTNIDTGSTTITTGAGAISGSFSGINAFTRRDLSITTGAGTVSATDGTGIVATSLRAFMQPGGTVTVETNGDVTGSGTGIFAQSDDGNVSVTTAGGTTVTGTTGNGIDVNAGDAADSPNNAIVNAGSDVTGGISGIRANSDNGTADVSTAGIVTGGATGHGIDATGNTVSVLTNGSVGGGIHGISAVADAGNVSVTAQGSPLLVLVSGTSGAGINASATGDGLVSITNSTFLQGSTAGVVAASENGAITIGNSFVITNISLDEAGLAISTSGGATTITNNIGALINGRVVTGASADVLHNHASWFTQGDSDFGAGGDTVNNNANSGIFAGDDVDVAETTRFLNLENLNNSGFIDLSEQTAGDGSNISDRLSTSGNYNGTNAGLLVDAFLGGAGSLADVLEVDGTITGLTTITVNDTNAGDGGFVAGGILVVDGVAGQTAAERFALAGGPIDKGLFVYDLIFDEAAGDHLLVSTPEEQVFEALAVVSSNQEIWRETADAWSTRQENLRDVLAASHGVTAVADPPLETSTAPMASLWVSALGSWTERDSDVSSQGFDFDLSYDQEIYGVVGGADFATDVGSDAQVLFGLMAGYVDSHLDFDDSATSIDTDGATVGAYAALLSNGFFATVLVKADLLNMDVSTSEGEDDADVVTIGARGDVGYRVGNAVFVEPMISADAVSTDIDEFTIAGADIDAGTNESFRAGAGLRLGFGEETIRASATGRVWHVFATENEVDIAGLGLSDDELEGVYGDVSGQIDVNLASNATIYLKGGVLFSDDVTKPNATGGFALYW